MEMRIRCEGMNPRFKNLPKFYDQMLTATHLALHEGDIEVDIFVIYLLDDFILY